MSFKHLSKEFQLSGKILIKIILKRFFRSFKTGILLLFLHPVWFSRRLIAKMRLLKGVPDKKLIKNIDGVVFEFDFSFSSVMRNYYHNAYELETLHLLRKFLSKGDTFIDVGANMGYISAIGMSIVGAEGSVHSFEPVPAYFERLDKLRINNTSYKIKTNMVAVGRKQNVANICIAGKSKTGWNTIVPGQMPDNRVAQRIEVTVIRLDQYIKDNNIQHVRLIKIDTEGYEFEVLQGLSECFESSNFRPVILCEINPRAYPLLGYSTEQMFEYLKQYDYHAFSAFNPSKEITVLKRSPTVLFLSLPRK